MGSRVMSSLMAGVLVAGLVACSSATKGTSSSAASASVAPRTSAPAIAPGAKYVSLGSSIASGYGISVQSACGRSSRDYGQLIAAKLQLKLVDVSCGAAVIPNVLDTKQGEAPPQIDAVTADTKLITISVGGNDIGFNGTALACGDPNSHCTAPAGLEANLAALPGTLQSMVDRLRAKAPLARIVFVTYPREMPVTNCPALSLSDDELALLRSMGERLEATFVKVLGKSSVTFVDPYAVPGDHTACAAAGERWTNGYNVPTGEGFAYHPTALGHQAMAEMVEQALAR